MALATRPLEGRPELRDEAMTELMSRIGNQGVPLEYVDLSVPVARLEAVKPVRPSLRRWLLLAGLLVSAVLAIGGVVRDLFDAFGISYLESLQWRNQELTDAISEVPAEADSFEAWFERIMAGHLTEGTENLPLSGLPGDVETARLRERFPEDLGILQEHLTRRPTEAPAFMTGEERQLVARLDPDNALWPLMEIRWIENGAAIGSRRGTGSMTPEKIEACQRLHTAAAAMPILRNHGVSMLERQKAALPEPRGILELMTVDGMATLPRDGKARPSYWFGGGVSWFALRVSDLSAVNDREGLRRLWDEMIAIEKLRQAAPEAVLFDFQRHWAFMDQNVDLLERQLGAGATTPYPETRYYLEPPLSEQAPIMVIHGRLLPGDLTADEMRPLVMAEQAFFQRFLAWGACVVLGILLALTLLESIRRSRRVKGLARGLMPLLDWRDHAWVAGLGIVLPWLWYLVIARLTPLGGHWGDDEETAILSLMQAAMALVLGVVLVIQTSEWRWALRGALLGFGRGSRIFGWAAAAVTALAIPAGGFYSHFNWTAPDHEEMYLLGCAGAGSMGLLWLLWVAIVNLFTGGRAALRPNLVSRTVLVWMLAGTGTVLLSAGVLRGLEAWWISRDTLLHPKTSRNFINAMEERAVKEHSKRVLEWMKGL